MGRYYKLAPDGKTPVECEMMDWAENFEAIGRRRTAETHRWFKSVYVSTVFLGMDHSYGFMYGDRDAPPVLWETMIFGGPHDGEQRRYTSHDMAVKGHARCVRLARWGRRNVPNDDVATVFNSLLHAARYWWDKTVLKMRNPKLERMERKLKLLAGGKETSKPKVTVNVRLLKEDK